MKRLIAIYVGIITCLSVLGQYSDEQIEIRNYKGSLMIVSTRNQHVHSTFNDYGSVQSIMGNNEHTTRYLYQAQEFEQLLNLYLFASRIYSPSEKRFFQPDPKSQYHSPYLFVGSDPINIIDINGQEGKSLILYGEEHALPADDGINAGILDLREAAPNNYYVPLSDYLNGEVGELPEWNGNVMIQAHMSPSSGAIEVESSSHEDDLKTLTSSKVDVFETSPDNYMSRLDPKKLGASLRDFSEARNVKIENILAAGCHGEDAAKKIGEGFISKGKSKLGEQKLTTSGVRNDYVTTIVGPHGTFHEGEHLGTSRTQFHISPANARQEPIIEEDEEEGDEIFESIQYRNQQGELLPQQFAEGEEIQDLTQARVSDGLVNDFRFFHFEY